MSTVAKKRSIAIVGHGASGKTTLGEHIFYEAGAISRLGRVEEGNTVSDFLPLEVERRISIGQAIMPFEYKGHEITMIDTPGFLDFVGEMVSALSAVDGAIIVINANNGIEFTAKRAWQYCQQFGIPAAIYVNMLDKEDTDFAALMPKIKEAFGMGAAPLFIPVGKANTFKAVAGILDRKLYSVDNNKTVVADVTGDVEKDISARRSEAIESIVEQDEELMMAYMEGQEPSEEDLNRVFKLGVHTGKVIPVIAGSAVNHIGVGALLNLIVDAMPSPMDRLPVKCTDGNGKEVSVTADENAPAAVFVFRVSIDPSLGEMTWLRVFRGKLKPGDQLYNPKRNNVERVSSILRMTGKTRKDLTEAGPGDIVATVKLKDTHTGDSLCPKESVVNFPEVKYPVTLSFEAVKADKNDMEKIGQALHKFCAEDPTMFVKQNPENNEMVIYAMGEQQLNVLSKQIEQTQKVKFDWQKPRINYRETIRGTARCQGRYKKQSGGKGQFGDCWLKVEPLAEGSGFEFVDAIVGGAIPGKFLPAVEKGVRDTMNEGVLAGYHVVDIKVTCDYGSYHSVDSSELAFKMAGRLAFKAAFKDAQPVLLEPVMNVSIIIPDKYMGDVMGDLNTRRGRMQGMEAKGSDQIIRALVPHTEMYKYINTLRSLTQGQGYFEMEFSHYEDVPANIASEIIAKFTAKDDDE